MRDSVRLGRIAGIPIGLHWSIALIVGLFTMTLAGTIFPLEAPGYSEGTYVVVAGLVAISLLVSIVAHELGHSVVAQRNGVNVGGITLFALGGLARLENDPRSPGAAARIALAGPAVSIAIGIAGLVGANMATSLGVPPIGVAGLLWLGIINLAMAVFNLLPALPLDGGRALQALLWKRDGNPHRATIKAATVGRYIGWAMVGFGLWQFIGGSGGLWTAFIGWFILSSARAEAIRARFELRRHTWAPPTWIDLTQPRPEPPADPAIIDVDSRSVP
ncbi:MAG: site-2 protease family protein [Actinomycetia bacterium]|nr:site-2 protease family protein [Actinomycetes bacterium]MCP4224872.1 site-2 protease family protein [Actinomycetes bacterium]MCP5031305.1 site-2 protease family protein [Actinomycetes bacterium]